MKILFKNLRGAFTGAALETKQGRRVAPADGSFVAGPLHILIDDSAKRILSLGSEVVAADLVHDCEGMVATAAFVDSHTHALFGGSRWGEYFIRWGGGDYAKLNASGGGIRKTFRDTRASADTLLEGKLLRDIKSMHAEGVRLLEVKSGYGETLEEELRILRLIKKAKKDSDFEIVSTFLGLHAIPSQTDEASWTAEAIKLLPLIKSEGLAEYVDSFPEQGFFSLASARSFSEAAIKHGFKVKIHADEITAFGAADLGAEIGATSVDHLQKISDTALARLGKSLTVATLLPATSFYLGIDYAPARKIIASGARVALASDFNPGTAPNSSILFTAMLAASQLKMSPAEILCGLTYNAAAALNRDDTFGLLKVGYTSEFLLWDLKTEDFLEEIFLSGVRPATIS